MKPGDPITAVDGGLLVHVRIDAARTDVVYTKRFALAGVVAGPTLKPEDEHVTWVRGHVTEHDEAGMALLALATMKFTRVMDLKDAENLYIGGSITKEEWTRNLDLWDSEFAAGERDQ